MSVRFRVVGLQADGLISSKPYPLLFVLGRYRSDRQSAPEDLLPFLDEARYPGEWMVCAFGRRELECMRLAWSRGGHARVGFENNTLRPDGTLLDSTAESVRLAASMLTKDGFEVADADTARDLLIGPRTVG